MEIRSKTKTSQESLGSTVLAELVFRHFADSIVAAFEETHDAICQQSSLNTQVSSSRPPKQCPSKRLGAKQIKRALGRPSILNRRTKRVFKALPRGKSKAADKLVQNRSKNDGLTFQPKLDVPSGQSTKQLMAQTIVGGSTAKS
jgi:hypothetical protein